MSGLEPGVARKALVVDDERDLRILAARALQAEGFACDMANDGVEAARLIERQHYQVVITDLRMPHKHGHALAVEILARPVRPLLFILTGVIEPRLAKDLIARGVDDISFKPVDYRMLAAKIRARVDMRQLTEAATPPPTVALPAAPAPPEPAPPVTTGGAEFGPSEFQQGFGRVANLIPASPGLLEVYHLSNVPDVDVGRLAGSIGQHKALSAEIVALANSRFYNRSGTKVKDLQRAVVQIGHKRIGQLTLAANAQAALTPAMSPLLDAGLLWRRSIAAGLAMELLIAQGGHQAVEHGLSLCAAMLPLGRAVLTAAFPVRYQSMIELCLARKEALVDHEQRVFCIGGPQVMADVLSNWGISAEAHEPLRQAARSFESLVELREPFRRRAELVKIAGQIACVALGSWQPFDAVELPPVATLERLQLHSVSNVLEELENSLAGINLFTLSNQTPREVCHGGNPWLTTVRSFGYHNLSSDLHDLLPDVLRSTGAQLVPENTFDSSHLPQLFNCLGLTVEEARPHLGRSRAADAIMVTEEPSRSGFLEYGRVISLPAAYSALVAALRE